MFIDEYYINLTNLEKEVLNLIYKNMEEFVGLTIQDFSKKLYTTSSTITKLIQKIGFTSYKSFQKSLEMEIKERTINAKTFKESQKDLTFLLSMISQNINAYSEAHFNKISEMIINSPKIIMVGFGNSFIAANELFQSLSRLGFNCFCTNDIFGNITLFENISPDSTIVFYSHQFKSRTIFRAFEMLSSFGFKTILISSNNQVEDKYKFSAKIIYESYDSKNISFNTKLNQITINYLLKYCIKNKISEVKKDKPSILI
ncbi:hypothetical protein SHELI_v1c10220 [Spiroplasma helicoides]|uniref:HTH rpiR-type domain-containing protein n=1 Tax=Spiroplasma helicoides TaxID=216938 RepID=A0A1B3SM03_9MOLU|nr:MurR/RpiR family transcriptional regulator [Spiroplasma helicoides]AOG60969.1 hypothetical protein SHELI_v1c10220 [Spiroplasma helicoides]